ncbi:DUF1634 domain-containing protein [Companilactobacillus sp. DQM5]|uniref:DUF1634 domain-containing protein n=1 Tax=Companilactobacillus sp. DQM5 TaxID=3463359 RepID=UPI0040589FF9
MIDEKKALEMKKIEIVIGKILRLGVMISVAVILIGIVMYLINNGSGYSQDTFPITLTEIIKGVFNGKSYAIMMLGLLLLIFTPVLRVIVSIYAFAKEKDIMYTVITIIVLLILIVAMTIGFYK